MGSEPFWVEIAKQVPALLLFVYSVTVFLKHITEEKAGFERLLDRKTSEMDRIVSGVKEFQRDLTKENLAALERLSRVVEQNTAQLALNRQEFRKHKIKTRLVTKRRAVT